MARQKYDQLTPFADKFGQGVGRGQDNVVVELNNHPEVVVKFNHDYKVLTTKEQSFQKVLYKKRKYELLKHCLGDYIPDTSFVLGHKVDGKKRKIKEYTIQTRVPEHTLASLTREQKQDPRLRENLEILLRKLTDMNSIVEMVNQTVRPEARIDVRLDLKQISDIVREKVYSGDEVSEEEVTKLYGTRSKNILVDPETMDLFCIDFGRGDWSDEKEETLRTIIREYDAMFVE